MSLETAIAFSLLKLGYKLRRLCVSNSQSASQSAQSDLTGRILMEPTIAETLFDHERGILFAYFDSSLAHSFWRAQELTLFKRVSANFARPILDFGCGDGSFSACIFDSLEYGIDIDETALLVARGYDIYQELLTFEEIVARVPPSSVATVFSCSVLEHTTDLCSCIRRIYSLLKPGGRFLFSVPTSNLTEQMVALIDSDFALDVNTFMFHRNLRSQHDWKALLSHHGFCVEHVLEFQPLDFTKKYFCLTLLGSRGTGDLPGFALLRYLFWRAFRNSLLDDVAQSVDRAVTQGANIFVSAIKP